MAVINRLGVTNLRSLRSIDPPVRIAPITVLLGRNSVGKSTFARIFPLFRQSSERKKRSPVLWFGELVDFGSLSRTVTDGENEISFTFSIEIDSPVRKGAYALIPSGKTRGKIESKLSITLGEDSLEQSGVAKKISIDLFGSNITIDLKKKDQLDTPIFINNKQYTPSSKESGVLNTQGIILPLLFFYSKQKNATGELSWVNTKNHWDDLPAQIVRKWAHQNTSIVTCRNIARRIPLGTIEQISLAIKSIPGPSGWTMLMHSDSLRKTIASELHEALMISHVSEIIEHVDSELSTYFKGVRYLKPLRATAERYYRRLDLSVSEIDPDGSNLPVFLDSLSKHELSLFRKWTKELLGVDAYPQREGDQVMVMAQGKNDSKAFNIADMGFGISQVLPIAAQLWATTLTRRQIGNASIVVLEQPELHLHPDSQARLADVFAGTIKAKNNQHSNQTPSILIETHSQYLVNRLGQLVENGQLSPDDISIILFESSGENPSSTKVRISEFSEDGILKNWPYGFFEPEID